MTVIVIAMWKDENFGIPNKALMRLLPRDADYKSGDQRAFPINLLAGPRIFNAS
jgi:hypothetical protein